MLSELKDVGKESQDKNTLEARIVKNMVDQKNQLQLRFGLLGGFIRCIEIQHGDWLMLVSKRPTTSELMILSII